MSSLKLNKDNPKIEYESGIVNVGEFHEYRARVFYAKHKGKNRIIFRQNHHLAVASTVPIKNKLVKQMFIDRAWAEKKRGRFYDWAFDIKTDIKGEF